jgi:hypothetical protein
VTGDAGSGSSPVSVSGALSGLAPSTTYHYRLVATNADGTATGDDATFTTAAAPAAGGGSSSGATPPPPAAPGPQAPAPRALGLTLSLVPAKLRTLIAKGLGVKGNCGEDCTVTIKLVISSKDAKRLKLRTTIGSVKGKGGTTLKLRLSSKAKKALARLRSIRVKLVATAVAPDGRKSSSLSRSVRLKR